MRTMDELSDEERTILEFVKRYFEENKMFTALRLVEHAKNMELVRTILLGYRELYIRERQR